MKEAFGSHSILTVKVNFAKGESGTAYSFVVAFADENRMPLVSDHLVDRLHKEHTGEICDAALSRNYGK